ncbi:MAG: RCC1 domain-containing protein [Kofleriaceae bacterium]
MARHWLALSLLVACGGRGGSSHDQVLPADASPDGSDTPVPTDGSVESPCALEGGGLLLCIKTRDSSLYCAGSDLSEEIGYETENGYSASFGTSQPTLAGSIVQASAGRRHICVRTAPGDLYCWGSNWEGELSVPHSSTTERPDPIQVRELGDQTLRVYTGELFSCAQTVDSALWCWGNNDESQLGLGHVVSTPDPSKVTKLGTTTLSVSLGVDHACAVRTDGSLWCWGHIDNSIVQTWYEPAPVPELTSHVAEVVTGGRFTCVRKTDNTAWCWGDIGPHADENLGSSSMVEMAEDVVELTAGKYHACARKTDGTVWCWGEDNDAQLGDGMSRSGANAQPAIQVPLPGPVVALTSLETGSCALDAAGDAWCWGGNDVGQFGVGSYDYYLPVTKIMSNCTPPTPSL